MRIDSGGPTEEDTKFVAEDTLAQKDSSSVEDIGEVSPEAIDSPERMAAITSVVLSKLGTPRPREERHNAAVAMSQAAEVARILQDAELEIPAQLVNDLQALFAEIKAKTNFKVDLDNNVLDILEKILSQNEGFSDLGLPPRETMAFLEQSIIKALGGAKKSPKVIAGIFGKAFIGSSPEEIRTSLSKLRDALNVIKDVQKRRWDMDPASGKSSDEFILPEAETVLKILEGTGISVGELAENPITVDTMLGIMEVDKNWLQLIPEEQTAVIYSMQYVADNLTGATLEVTAKGPVVTAQRDEK